MKTMLYRIAAFCDDDRGGNPAGVMIGDTHPDESEMRRIAAEIGYSETAFAMPAGKAWRVRYFSPESEVPFCGHATIALGAALALEYGNDIYELHLNDADITVEGQHQNGILTAALQSPPTRSERLADDRLDEVLGLFGYTRNDLDTALPPARIHGGADHIALCLNSRERLADMAYNLDDGRELMRREGIVTILLGWAENARLFHTRNPFASGGVYEDPATGAATAAFAGYLRDLGWSHDGNIEVLQGADMGSPSRLHAQITSMPGASIQVSGRARIIED